MNVQFAIVLLVGFVFSWHTSVLGSFRTTLMDNDKDMILSDLYDIHKLSLYAALLSRCLQDWLTDTNSHCSRLMQLQWDYLFPEPCE